MLERYRTKRPGTPLANMLLYELGKSLSVLIFLLLYRVRRLHRERIPDSGPVLIAANHQSYFDPPLVGSGAHRHVDFIGRLGLFKSKAFGAILAAVNCTPIKEEGSDTAAIKEILRRLGEGRAVVIFPEGSRTTDGAMEPLKRGVAVLVKRARCPVVPAAVEGCFDAWPRSRRWPRFFGRRVAVMYGEAIPYETLMADGPDAALGRLEREIDAMRLELRAEMRRLTRGRYPAPGPGDFPLGSRVIPAAPAPGSAPPSAGASRTAAAPSSP